MRRAAAGLLTLGFAGMGAFQVALAAGAPFGHAAWGGTNAHLTSGQRTGSAISVVFYLAAIAIVRRRAAGSTGPLYRQGTWVLGGIMAIAAVANIVSGSRWENFLLAPIAVVLFLLCAVVARTASRREVAHTATPAATS
jgi:FtsH-binding integral membrane protein